MKNNSANRIIFVLALITLTSGFLLEKIWLVSGVLGLGFAIFTFFHGARRGDFGADILAIFAILGALAVQEFFASSIITLMLATGRALEDWAEGQAERHLRSLIHRIPRKITRITSSGSLEVIPVESVNVDDLLMVRTGEVIPTDGVAESLCSIDESAVTGEPLPVNHERGEFLTSGTLNVGSPFNYRATDTVEKSTYSALIKLVLTAQEKSAPGIRIANRWALRFTPIALLIAGIAWAITGEAERAVAVLVIATPCPLILAVPIAIVAGLSRAAKHGAIIKSGAVLESLAVAEVVLLDKTGTLTLGGPHINSIQRYSQFNENEILRLAASLDQYSPHVIGQTIVERARVEGLAISTARDVIENPGHSIMGVVEGKALEVGQIRHPIPDHVRLSDPLNVGVYCEGELIGVIGLKDPIRNESKEFIARLRELGVRSIAMLTGDKYATAQAVAEELGITEVFAELTPEHKMKITQEYLDRTSPQRKTVVLVGDGVNDAPALVLADVGVAMGARGSTAASEAADMVIVEDSIDRLTQSIEIAQNSRRRALQAAGAGIALSVAGMACGAFGIMSVSVGAIAQECIDVLAIVWALTALRD